MKAIKIDIKQEVLDLEPKPYYLFYRTDGNIPVHWIKENVRPNDMARLYTEEYKVFELNNIYAKEPRIKYLIKVKDKELVDTLVKIEQDVIEHKILIRMEGVAEAEKSRIRSLPFWKRLFNKF